MTVTIAAPVKLSDLDNRALKARMAHALAEWEVAAGDDGLRRRFALDVAACVVEAVRRINPDVEHGPMLTPYKRNCEVLLRMLFRDGVGPSPAEFALAVGISRGAAEEFLRWPAKPFNVLADAVA